MVAGGGGGGAMDQDGLGDKDGSAGGGGSIDDPGNGSPQENGGGGAANDGEAHSTATGNPGQDTNDNPLGGAGGTDGTNGGFGFGGGGSGSTSHETLTTVHTGLINIPVGWGTRGGGGGGYTGGNRRGVGQGGYGGTSYINNSGITVSKTSGSSTDNPANGYVNYQMINNPNIDINNINMEYAINGSQASMLKVNGSCSGDLKVTETDLFGTVIPHSSSDNLPLIYPGIYKLKFYSSEVFKGIYNETFKVVYEQSIGAQGLIYRAFATNIYPKVESNGTVTFSSFSPETLKYKLYKGNNISNPNANPFKQNNTGVFNNLNSGTYIVSIGFDEELMPSLLNTFNVTFTIQ